MIVLRSPKGWTGPKTVDGLKTEGSWRAHQVPISDMNKPGHLQALEAWMRSYKPEELFDDAGRLRPEIAALAPVGERRMSANPPCQRRRPHASVADARFYGLTPCRSPCRDRRTAKPTQVMGGFLRDVMRLNASTRNFRVLGPDETASNRLQAVLEVTGRDWDAATNADDDEHLDPDGRVMEILSEHTCQGWLEGYLADGPPWPVQLLRGLHPHRRFDVQPACQMAENESHR